MANHVLQQTDPGGAPLAVYPAHKSPRTVSRKGRATRYRHELMATRLRTTASQVSSFGALFFASFLCVACTKRPPCNLPIGTVEGDVVEHDGMLPLPDVVVVLIGGEGHQVAVGTTDSFGHFRIAGIPSGVSYTVRFSLSGYVNLVLDRVHVNACATTRIRGTSLLFQRGPIASCGTPRWELRLLNSRPT